MPTQPDGTTRHDAERRPVDDGGSAFPVPSAFIPATEGSGALFINTDEYGRGPMPGMSLRDYFAAQAMAGILADTTTRRGYSDEISEWPRDADEFRDAVAGCAYAHADAMLAARKAGGAS
jgi:hypothetical protein